MTGPHVRIELGRTPVGNHIWVDDTEITNIVEAVRIECTPATNHVTKVSIDIFPAGIKVDGELVEAIQRVLVQREVTP